MTEAPVIVVSTYPPEHCGVGRDARALVQELRAIRPVLVLGNTVQGEAPVEDGARFVWTKDDPLFPWQIFRAAREVAPQGGSVVHVFHHFFLYGGARTILEFPFLLLLLRIGGFRVVVQFQSVIDPAELRLAPPTVLSLAPGRSTSWALRRFYHWIDRLSDALVVCTVSMRDLLVRVYHVPASRVTLVPVGWQRPPAFAPARDVGPLAGPTVLFHGFLDPSKGIDVLLDALALGHRQDPSLTLIVAGELSPHLGSSGPVFLQGLRARSEEDGVKGQVRFTGYQDDDALRATLAEADVVVLPYTMLYSHGGSAVLSRVAGLGRPLVASRISRFSDELVDGENALLVPTGNAAAIAKAIERLRNEPGLAHRLGANLRALALARGWDRSAEILDRAVYRPLLAESEVA